MMYHYLCPTYGKIHKEDISAPHGPLAREGYPTFTHSSLSQGTYLTNKHDHFKSRGIKIENRKHYKNFETLT